MSGFELCVAKRFNGKPCQALGILEGGFCRVHHPDALQEAEERIHELYLQKSAEARAEKEREELRSVVYARQKAEREAEIAKLQQMDYEDQMVLIKLRADCRASMDLAAKLLNNPEATPEQVEHGKALMTFVQQTRLLAKEEDVDKSQPKIGRRLY